MFSGHWQLGCRRFCRETVISSPRDFCGFTLGARHWAYSDVLVYMLCCVAPDAESQCILSLELRCMNSLFLLCGVWRYPFLSPVWQLLGVSTDLCWLLIYSFGRSLSSCVYTVHMWKLFQWFVMGNIVSASISPNQYASNNTSEMCGRTLAPGKISKGWTKSKTSSGLTIPKWYLWSCQMFACTPVY